MSMVGHHVLLFGVAGGVALTGALLAFTLGKKKKKTVDTITEQDMQRIDDRLVSGDFARTESRFRRRYGVDASPKDFVVPPSAEPPKAKEEPKP